MPRCYLAHMDSEQLSKHQATILRDNISRSLGYLSRLRERMERTHFPPDDELLVLVKNAQDAVQRLWVDLHYRSCDGQVGRRKKQG
jgi:hypothetical protein